eukprot:g12632.t1
MIVSVYNDGSYGFRAEGWVQSVATRDLVLILEEAGSRACGSPKADKRVVYVDQDGVEASQAMVMDAEPHNTANIERQTGTFGGVDAPDLIRGEAGWLGPSNATGDGEGRITVYQEKQAPVTRSTANTITVVDPYQRSFHRRSVGSTRLEGRGALPDTSRGGTSMQRQRYKGYRARRQRAFARSPSPVPSGRAVTSRPRPVRDKSRFTAAGRAGDKKFDLAETVNDINHTWAAIRTATRALISSKKEKVLVEEGIVPTATTAGSPRPLDPTRFEEANSSPAKSPGRSKTRQRAYDVSSRGHRQWTSFRSPSPVRSGEAAVSPSQPLCDESTITPAAQAGVGCDGCSSESCSFKPNLPEI